MTEKGAFCSVNKVRDPLIIFYSVRPDMKRNSASIHSSFPVEREFRTREKT